MKRVNLIDLLAAVTLLDELDRLAADREDRRLNARKLDDEARERAEARADWLDEREAARMAAVKMLGYGD